MPYTLETGPGASDVHEEIEVEVDFGSRGVRRHQKRNEKYIEAVTFFPYISGGD